MIRGRRGGLQILEPGPAVQDCDWYFIPSDTHYGPAGVQNRDEAPPGSGPTDPDERLVAALIDVVGKPFPIGGKIGRPTAVINLGDLVHHFGETPARFAADYKRDGTGRIPFPCYFIDGNHDENVTRDVILGQFGSRTWGFKLGRVFFQAMTEEFVSDLNTNPPSAAQINGAVAASLASRPAGEPTILCFHRALSGGYEAEWAADALNALEALAASKATICFLHGHDHYSQHFSWRTAFRVYSPGSVTQSPMSAPPYGATYPESFLVMRVSRYYCDVANYIFGYNVARAWTPGTWEWSERLAIRDRSPLPL